MVTGIDTASFKLIVHRETSIWIVYTFCIFSRSQESLNLRNAKKIRENKLCVTPLSKGLSKTTRIMYPHKVYSYTSLYLYCLAKCFISFKYIDNLEYHIFGKRHQIITDVIAYLQNVLGNLGIFSLSSQN